MLYSENGPFFSGKKKHGRPVDGFAILLSSTNSEDQKGKRTVL